MNIFLQFIEKHKALKKVYEVIFSCTDKYHLDGARRLINLYVKNYQLPKKEADKLWKAWEMKRLQIQTN